ncbi:hypothetical protein [Mesorhizobium sp.]|nr:hypothetical protein [Mesorhizobium sp.]
MFNKMKLDGPNYLAAQRAYDGWSLFAIVVLGALLSTAALAILLYRASASFGLVVVAFLSIGATQLDADLSNQSGDPELDCPA